MPRHGEWKALSTHMPDAVCERYGCAHAMSSSYDILIVGAGPAGIAAAVAAARVNGNVGLIDDNPAPGGQIWRRDASHGRHHEAERWLNQLDAASVERLQGCHVFDSSAPGILHAE